MITKASKSRRQTYMDAILSSVVWTLLDRGTSLLKHVFIASALGLGVELDVFYMAVGLISVFVFSWSRIADVIAVPRLIELIREGDEEKTLRFTGDLFSLSVGFSVLLAILMTLGWPLCVQLAWGFDAQRNELLEQTIYLAEPLLLLSIPLRMLYSFAKAYRRFSISYRNEFLISVVMLACIAAYPHAPGVMIGSFSLGMTLAFILAISTLGREVRLLGCPWSYNVRQLLPLVPALGLVYATQYLYSMVDRQLVSFLPEGLVGAIAYGWTIINFVPALLRLDGPFITIYSEAAKDPEKKAHKLNQLISGAIAMGSVISILCFGFAEDFVGLFLERGAFTREDTLRVAGCTSFFAFSILPIVLIGPIGNVFQVENRLLLITKRVLFGLFLNVIFGVIFLFGLNLGAEGVALATSISQWGMLLSSLWSVSRLGIPVAFKRHTRWLLRSHIGGFLALWLVEPLKSLDSSYWMLFPESLCFLLLASLPILIGRGEESRFARALARQSFQRFLPGRS